MTAFIVSLVMGLLLTGIVPLYARRRPVGQLLTWGEAFAAATFVFGLFVLAYGTIPHQWLTWCDKELSWRADKTGIPLGPFGMWFWDGGAGKAFGFIPVDKNVFWPDGITFFGRGQIILTAEHIRDIVASTIYIVFLGVHFYLWTWWQKRGQVQKDKAQREALTTSAYGRPLKKAEA